MEKDIEMFKCINQGNDDGIEGFIKINVLKIYFRIYS